MKTETVTVHFDVAKLMKAGSRATFASLPRPKRIGDRRRKPERYKPDYKKGSDQ